MMTAMEKAEAILESISPGRKLYGNCNGYFGRSAYGPKTIIESGFHRGKVWIVVEYDYDGDLLFASGVPMKLPAEWVEAEDE